MTHLLRDHANSLTQSQVRSFIDTQKRPSLFPFLHCPFCYTPAELDLRGIKDLYEVKHDTYVHVERSEGLQKHIATHLRNLSMLAWLEPEDGGGSFSHTTVSNSGYRERSENLSYITLDFEDSQGDNESGRFPVDESYDSTIHWVPELVKDVDWGPVQKRKMVSGDSALPEDDPRLRSFVESYRGQIFLPPRIVGDDTTEGFSIY
jgi:hypothetical protein